MSKSNIEERLFKIDEIASFDSSEGKKTFFYETEKNSRSLMVFRARSIRF